jgi:DNA-binding transcriptional ArsR family regulator
MGLEAAAELCLVLRELGHNAELVRRPPGVRTADTTLTVIDTEQSTRTALQKVLAGGPSMVLVSTNLRPPHREILAETEAGWLDRSGHLRLPALGVDQRIQPLAAPVPPVADLWQRPSVVGVAFALLQLGGTVPTSYDLAFAAGLSHSTASRALVDLRSVGMIDENERPRRDALLAQLAARWSTRWFGLVANPSLDDAEVEARLVLGAQDDLRAPGWADLASDFAARVRTSAQPGEPGPRFLVPDRRALAWVLRIWGRAEPPAAVGFVSAAPHPIATAQRCRPLDGARWPTAHPVVMELEALAPGATVSADSRAGTPSRVAAGTG